MDTIEKKIQTYINRMQLIHRGDTIIVGVSGGADSMVLADFLYTHRDHYQINLKVAHVNHGMRVEAKSEADYVEAWCKERALPYFLHTCHIGQIAKEKRISEEEAGRQERYNFFSYLADEGDKVAVAHHRDDQVETMLMNFFRGSDIKGLGGIRSKRDNIIRPLLSLSKEEVIRYCKQNKVLYYEDASNSLPTYTRNKLRLEYIPYIETHVNPNIKNTLVRQGELYQEASDFIESYINKHYNEVAHRDENEVTLDIQRLEAEMPYIQKKMIYNSILLLTKCAKDISQKHIIGCIELLTAQSGKEVHLPYEIVAKRIYNKLVLKKQETKKSSYQGMLLELGDNFTENEKMCIRLTQIEAKSFKRYEEKMYTKYVDYDKIKTTLQMRTRESGDFITLTSGKKKLKKLFIDDKIPQDKRDIISLIVDEKEVIWVIGSRLNSKYFVTDKTKTILKLEIIKVDTQEGLC